MRLSALLTTPPKPSAIDDTFEAHIELWLSSLVRENYSPHTVSAYRTALYRFAGYVSEQGVDWQDCPKKVLEWFVAGRLEQDIKRVSIKQTITAIAQFYQFVIQNNPQTPIKNPTINYRFKSSPRPLPNILDVDMMGKLLDQPTPANPKQAKLWLRDKAMFELMYSSGLRLSELAGLDVGDVDLSGKVVQVLGKGKKMRVVPVGARAIASIRAYLPCRDDWKKGDERALFVSERHGTRLTARAIQLRLKACAVSAGIDQNLYPHLLRHCFASHLLSASGDLRAVQEMLGHSSVATTQIYTHVDVGTLNRIYGDAHPRAVKKCED